MDTWIYYITFSVFIFLPLPQTHRTVCSSQPCGGFRILISVLFQSEVGIAAKEERLQKREKTITKRKTSKPITHLYLSIWINISFFLVLQKNPLMWQQISIISFITEMCSCNGKKHNCASFVDASIFVSLGESA